LSLIGKEKFPEPFQKGEIGPKLSCEKLLHRNLLKEASKIGKKMYCEELTNFSNYERFTFKYPE